MTVYDLIVIVMVLGVIFLMMKNLAAKSTLKNLEKEGAVKVHHNSRPAAGIFRILYLIVSIAMVVIGIWIYMANGVDALLDSILSLISVAVAMLFFAISPYDIYEWVMTEKGIYIYNLGTFIPWGQVITTGVQKNKKNTRFKVILQIKKQQGEYLKAKYQLIGEDSEQEAEETAAMIREFVHALDRKKMYKRVLEEKKIDIRKRNWN